MRLTFSVLAVTLGACSSNAATGAPTNDGAPSVAVSKVCSVAPQGVGAVTRKTTFAAGKTRTYHLSVPKDLAAKQPAALVFALHGAGDTAPENMRDWFAVESQMPGALFVYPQALPRTRKDGSGGLLTRWDLFGDEDTALFDAILADVANEYCVDHTQVFVTGFSSGGDFSQNLACLRHEDVKGMAVVAGPGPFRDACGGAVPTWMTHDTDDNVLPIALARTSRDFWVRQNGCGKDTWETVAGRSECQRNTSCPAGAPVVYCETSGLAHQVPSYAVTAIGTFFNALRQ